MMNGTRLGRPDTGLATTFLLATIACYSLFAGIDAAKIEVTHLESVAERPSVHPTPWVPPSYPPATGTVPPPSPGREKPKGEAEFDPMRP